MLGLMQDWQLTVDKILDHAALNFPDQEIVTRTPAGPITRTTYRQLHGKAKRVSEALLSRGLQLGHRVATLAWNTADHMETWYGAMGVGIVIHTVNPRLKPEQIAWILNHAGNKALFFDTTFLPLVEAIADHLPNIETFVLYSDKLPEQTRIKNLMTYDQFLEGSSGSGVVWGNFEESTACGLCYTSGTTGNPKGVLYSHRSNVLHAFLCLQPDVVGATSRDSVLPVVPMFHVNAWGLPFVCAAAGSKLVFPGAQMDGASIYELLDTEKVKFTAAVPTIWMMLAQYLEQSGNMLPHLEKVMIGGAACPEHIIRLFEQKYGVEVGHGWGMTETSPLGTAGMQIPQVAELPYEEKIKYKMKQGRTPFGVEIKVVDTQGQDLPRDGESAGHLLVRGPGVVRQYYGGDGGEILDKDGWFDTGDVATIDPLGYMQITDRSKDVIKSGGEWISSMDLENHAVSHPAIAVAAALGIKHPKWDERPLLIVVLNQGATATREEILDFMSQNFEKWQVPDDVAFVNEIPLGATGKINKLALRETFKDYTLPTA